MPREETVPRILSKDKRRQVEGRHSGWPPSKALLDQLVAEATADAYGDSEQRVGFLIMLEDNLALPFETEVLGVSVTVERIDLTDAEGIVAVCRRSGKRQVIPVLVLPLPTPRPAGAEWIEAYRYWARGG